MINYPFLEFDELQKTNEKTDIIINKDPVTSIRTVNIERARNKIVNKVYNVSVISK